ncbi:hypothetical protein GCK32_001819 [Trichostrongylus colubriformis]|uniref:Uncharacterized protein n=1 Tax=Trichostrongylus colubriformis TaxID=6319 RepID=A0AAN8F671_TRICO
MTVEQVKNDAYWTAARWYILHKYRKTLIAIGVGLVAITAGGVYYYMKYREKKRQEKDPRKGKVWTGSRVDRGLASSIQNRPSDFSTTEKKSGEEMEKTQRAGDSTVSVSLSRKPRKKVWSLDEILDSAPPTGRKYKSKTKTETKSKTGTKKESEEKSKKRGESQSRRK